MKTNKFGGSCTQRIFFDGHANEFIAIEVMDGYCLPKQAKEIKIEGNQLLVERPDKIVYSQPINFPPGVKQVEPLITFYDTNFKIYETEYGVYPYQPAFYVETESPISVRYQFDEFTVPKGRWEFRRFRSTKMWDHYERKEYTRPEVKRPNRIRVLVRYLDESFKVLDFITERKDKQYHIYNPEVGVQISAKNKQLAMQQFDNWILTQKMNLKFTYTRKLPVYMNKEDYYYCSCGFPSLITLKVRDSGVYERYQCTDCTSAVDIPLLFFSELVRQEN